MKADGTRSRRVAETIRHYLTEALAREIEDPRLHSLVVTGVEVPDDLGVARVRVRLLVGDDDQAQRRQAVRALQGVQNRLRRSLGPRLGLKRVPELKFSYDTGLDYSRRVDELLREIAAEDSGDSDSGTGDSGTGDSGTSSTEGENE